MTAAVSLSAEEMEERLDEFLDPVLSSRRTAAAPARRLAGLSRERQRFVLHWVEVIARSNAEMAYQFASLAPDAFDVMDQEALQAWLIHAMDVYDKSGLHPGIAALRQVDEYARRAQERVSGLAFEEIAGVLERFVQGLNGRPLVLSVADEVYTDTETVFLPAVVTRFAAPEDNFKLYKALAAHHWAQTWYGTLREALAAELSRYGDAVRAAELYQRLETVRLDAVLARDLPGLRREMQGLLGRLGETLVPPGWEALAARLGMADAGPRDSLDLLARIYPDGLVPSRLCFQGSLFPERVAQTMAARRERDKEAFRIALARLSAEKRPLEPSAQPQERRFSVRRVPDEINTEVSRFELHLDGVPITPPDDARRVMDSIIQDLDHIPEDYLVAAGDGGYVMVSGGAGEDDAAEDVWKGTYHEKGAYLYNEWDHERKHYRKNWCTLREVTVHPQSPHFVGATLRKYSGLAKTLRKTFEALRGEERFLKKQPQGDEVDIDALVEAIADARSGMEMTDRLFAKRRKVERDIAVMFMVDMSGSTKGWINDAEREALVLLCEALETLGDRYAIYGFSGMTRKRCELFRVKRFDEPYSDEVKARISGIAPQDYTRMGVAIRHLSRLLNEVEARTRVLVTLSDGKPDDYDGYRGSYGIEDTRQALIEARRDGIHPFCITIDSEARDYLPHMYGAVNYAVIDEVRKLPLKISDIYRKLTT